MTMTLKQFREATKDLPGDAQVFGECGFVQFDLERVMGIGQATDDPGLILKLGPPMVAGRPVD